MICLMVEQTQFNKKPKVCLKIWKTVYRLWTLLGKANSVLVERRREQIMPELNKNSRQLAFSRLSSKIAVWEWSSKCGKGYSRDKLVGTISDPEIPSKYLKTEEVFFYSRPGLLNKRKDQGEFSTPLSTKYTHIKNQLIPEHSYILWHVKEHCEMASHVKVKVKVLNTENKAIFISKDIEALKKITLDQWVIDTIRSAEIEIEDLIKVPLGELAQHKNLSDIEKILFKKK